MPGVEFGRGIRHGKELAVELTHFLEVATRAAKGVHEDDPGKEHC